MRRLISLAVLAIVFFGGLIIFWQSAAPRRDAKTNAVNFARKYAGLKDETDFYLFNRKKTYFTVAGTNNKNQQIYVIIAKKGGQTVILKQSSGIREQQANSLIKKNKKPQKILKTTLGIWQKSPVWEVTYLNHQGNLCYTLFAFKNGKVVKEIENL
ncbi:DUF5590 domain-containing protein [Liquorilactobacillus oeni]|uniref:Cell wall elongation regulator TseB-like domain-containing protein n=1 Tax=Liquorilactobacillus oeni DSM 19972 TaxID=1423777 RepID=A0A0R1M7R2_9LACO|nr:DUF5590 domain-containing protein [Liquorilactobacillus oeni]KRL04224.1 hypothetical protein FD46_GL001344 [Liquorilactobacillus oeni DSM 19972]